MKIITTASLLLSCSLLYATPIPEGGSHCHYGGYMNPPPDSKVLRAGCMYVDPSAVRPHPYPRPSDGSDRPSKRAKHTAALAYKKGEQDKGQ